MRGNCAAVYDRVGARSNLEIPPAARICKLCDTGAVEDVRHVVSACPCYAVLRSRCLERLNTCLTNQTLNDRLRLTLQAQSDTDLTALFLGDIFTDLPS